MKDSELSVIAKSKDEMKHPIDDNLYLKPLKSGKASWIFRYTFATKRKEITLGTYGKAPRGITLKKARELASDNKANIRNGIDPKTVRKQSEKMTVDAIAQEWLKERRSNIENPQIPERVYRRDIQPHIGHLLIDQVTSKDIYNVVQKIKDSGRPSVANDALDHCKHIFTQAIILNTLDNNPASILKPKHAGGTEKSRTRNLEFSEIEIVLSVMRSNKGQFTRDNYIAVCLLLTLGVRKGELIAAKWSELDLNEQIWKLPEARTKKKAPGLAIGLPDKIMPFLNELKVRACGSKYLFPSRRASKRREYISDDTINHALNTLFGIPSSVQKKKGIKLPNLMQEAGIEEHFTIHDLRRTCRSRLSQLKTVSNVAEKCLNHKIKGVEGVYDQWGYFDERTEALNTLANRLAHYW
ncbi:tyrosine-type recombinase/integrase [Alteromonas lipotrueae]|uniref:tyrosine-type recombinase/integrase n=1 Tax=Alteromonas lipotrueae TaxID=2803814 RepID=UPI001C48313B|nr:site-specific integrase [Alteromonas lipotrueae]